MQKRLMAVFSFVTLVVINIVANIIFIPVYGAMAAAYITIFSEIFNTVFFGGYLWWTLRHEKISVDGGALSNNSKNHFGNFTVTQELLRALPLTDQKNKYTVFIQEKKVRIRHA